MGFIKRIFDKTIIVNLILAFGSFCLIIFFINWALKIYTNHGESINVPDLRGKSFEQATEELDDLDLDYVVVDSNYMKDELPLSVLDQTPREGSKVKQNRKIYLTINSAKPPRKEVPDLANKSSLKFARIQLESRGFKVGKLIYQPNPDLNAVLEVRFNGKIIKPGTMLPLGSAIDLVLGNGVGDSRIKVPYLLGFTFNEAQVVIKGNNLNLGAVVWPDEVEDSASCMVYRQIPGVGHENYIRVGEPIDIFLSQTLPDEVKMDSLYKVIHGESFEEAVLDSLP